MPAIEPIKGSSALFGQKTNRDFNRVQASIVSWSSTTNQETFDNEDYDLGKYPLDRFPDSKQNWRPEYDTKLRQFDIRKPDGSLWTQADANECLKKYPLSYTEDWVNPADRHKPIERCDIGNMDDAYFSHPAWVTLGEEGRIELGDTDFENVKLAMYAGNAGVRQDDGSQFRPGDVRFQIKNPEMDARREEAKVDNTMDAMDLFKNMDEDNQRMSDMLTMLGFRVPKNTSRTRLKKDLLPFVTEAGSENGVSKQDLFRKFAKLPKDELAKQAFIQRAIQEHVIVSGAGVYKYRDQIVGRSFSEVVSWFHDGKNAQQLGVLKEDLKDQIDANPG